MKRDEEIEENPRFFSYKTTEFLLKAYTENAIHYKI